MEHMIFASYGNDSIALIQWAHERGLSDVHVAYGDTGWAAEWWPARVDQAEAWVRTLGFVPHRIKGEAMGALVILHRVSFARLTHSAALASTAHQGI